MLAPLALALPRSFAQSGGYPAKPVKLVIPFPAGGATDYAARAIGVALADQWHQSVVPDNRVGAGSTLERTAVLRIAGVEESIVVLGAGSHPQARAPGFATRFGPADLYAIPPPRARLLDFIRAPPGTPSPPPSRGPAVAGCPGGRPADGGGRHGGARRGTTQQRRIPV